MEELVNQVGTILLQVVTNLTNPEAWKEALGGPGMTTAAFIVLNLIVFTETGLFFGFFLPGDSLLVTAGIVGHAVDWPIGWLILSLCISAIVGDTLGYWIGYKAGPPIFNRPSSRFFKADHLLAARAFFEQHGGKTIIIARFMPFIRTFAPVVAGAARMDYKRFLMFNVVGGIGWVSGRGLIFMACAWCHHRGRVPTIRVPISHQSTHARQSSSTGPHQAPCRARGADRHHHGRRAQGQPA